MNKLNSFEGVNDKSNKLVFHAATYHLASADRNCEILLIGPGKYIENMEHSGLISRHDFYMFELACRQLEKWKGTEFENVAL